MSNQGSDDAAAELTHAREQLHILDAVVTASEDPHSYLDVVLSSPDPEAARRALQDRFGFSEVQALAVMDLQFRRVTALDRDKIRERRRELEDVVRDLEDRIR